MATARGIIGDLKSLIIPYFYNNEKFESDRERVLKDVEEYFSEFEFLLSKHKFLAGDELTYVDFMLWEYIDELLVFDEKVVKKYPKLLELHKHIREIPAIKKYMESDAYIDRPFNAGHAAFKWEIYN